MKKMFLFAACLAVLACSCSENEEGTVKDVRASLKINANIGAPAVSRAEKTAWEAGDKLGLYVCNGTLGTPYNQNAVYTNTLSPIQLPDGLRKRSCWMRTRRRCSLIIRMMPR